MNDTSWSYDDPIHLWATYLFTSMISKECLVVLRALYSPSYRRDGNPLIQVIKRKGQQHWQLDIDTTVQRTTLTTGFVDFNQILSTANTAEAWKWPEIIL